MGDFGNKTPTHMGAAHAISQIEQQFQNRVPRELDKNFNIPRIRMILIPKFNLLMTGPW